MEEGDTTPVNCVTKPKSLKRKEVSCSDPPDMMIDDADDYFEDCPYLVLDSGKSDKRFKDEQTFVGFSSSPPRSSAGTHTITESSYAGSHYSDEAFYKDLMYVDDDEMEYALLQSHLDDFDIPTGMEVSIPWVTHVNGNNMNAFTASASSQSTSRVQNGNEKPPAPPEHVLQILMNQDSIAPNDLPEASMPNDDESPQTPKRNEQVPNASILIGSEKRLDHNEQVPDGLRHEFFMLYDFTVPNPSTGPSNISGGFNFSDPTSINPFKRLRTDFEDPLCLDSAENLACTGNVSTSSAGPSSSKTVNENAEAMLRRFDIFKKFDTVEDSSDHLFSKSNAVATRSWSKKIQDEWRILEKDLPDAIFVRVYESRMDLLRAAIIGAQGTPYHDGLFFFDMFFPSNYPNDPPQVKYHSGGLRINPNLYKCGKVCLSLLNTWSGSAKEKWAPGESTVLQVLVSIQGLILNEKPYFNEPGYEDTAGTFIGEKRSLDYNENTLIHSLKTMVYTIRKPPKHFEDLVVGHFFKRAKDILVACRAYMRDAQVGSVVEKENNKGQKGNTQQFKNDLAGYLKTLVEAFKQVGVKDCDKFVSEEVRI